MSLQLRDQILDVCRGADVNDMARAAADVLMISVILAAPDADVAERHLREIADLMAANVHQSYREYHAMREANAACTQQQ